jgi:hypothetical protein
MVEPEELLVQRTGVETRPLPKGALLVDLETGRCYRLNAVGAEIWALLARPAALREICAEIGRQHDQPKSVIEGDVRELVERLVSERLIETRARGA